MWAKQIFLGPCPGRNWLPAGLMSLFQTGKVFFYEMFLIITSAAFPLEEANLFVCLNLENPKFAVPFFVKNPFLNSDV